MEVFIPSHIWFFRLLVKARKSDLGWRGRESRDWVGSPVPLGSQYSSCRRSPLASHAYQVWELKVPGMSWLAKEARVCAASWRLGNINTGIGCCMPQFWGQVWPPRLLEAAVLSIGSKLKIKSGAPCILRTGAPDFAPRWKTPSHKCCKTVHHRSSNLTTYPKGSLTWLWSLSRGWVAIPLTTNPTT